MSRNLRWDGGWDNANYGTNAYAPASLVFENGTDDCDGLAEFGACVLAKNGYEAYSVGISTECALGHNVTGFVGSDGKKYAINNGQSIDGPFETWIDLAQFYIDRGDAEPDRSVVLFPPCLERLAVGSEVGDLPRTVVR